MSAKWQQQTYDTLARSSRLDVQTYIRLILCCLVVKWEPHDQDFTASAIAIVALIGVGSATAQQFGTADEARAML